MKLNAFTIALALLPFTAGCHKLRLSTSPQVTPAGASQVPISSIPIILVMGQSNAVGLGQYVPSTLPSGVIWRGIGDPRGIGVSFAEAYQAYTGHPQVVIAQCSVGGTGIDQWQPGGSLYNQCLGIIGNIKADYPTAQVATVLFWQGEYDAQTPNVPWSRQFISMINQLRGDLGDRRLSVEFCQIDTAAYFDQARLYPYWTQIQAQQASVVLSYATMVKTSDITDIADSLHVGTAGLATIGQRMFQSYKELI